MKIRGTTITTPMARSVVTDDTSVSNKPWSSKNTIDKLCPSFTESGHIVTCEPVEGYPLAVEAQPGMATKVTRCGLNLLPYPYSNKTKTVNGITFTDNGDGTITANGTATADAKFVLFNGSLGYPFSESMGIGFSGCPSGGSSSTYHLENAWCGLFDKGQGCQVTPSAASNTIKQYWADHLQIVIKSGYTARNLVFKPCLYYGYAVKGYQPYLGKATFAMTDDDNGVPRATVPALAGVNTLFVDDGELTVTGKSDPVAIINKLTNAILALGGNV